MVKTITKRVQAVRLFGFNFAPEAEMRAGETITSAAVTIVNPAPTTPPLNLGTVVFSGSLVQVPVSGGLAGIRYLLKCAATTSGGKTLVLFGRLWVVDPVE